MKLASYQIIIDVYDREPKYLITYGKEKLAATGNVRALGWAIEQLINKQPRDAA